MIEKLLGRYLRTISFKGPDELASALRECPTPYCRAVVYPRESGTIIIIHYSPEVGARAVGYEEGEGLVTPDIGALTAGGYAEIYGETAEQARLDSEIIESAAVRSGIGIGEVMVELSIEELAPASSGGSGCDLRLDEIIERLGNRLVVDDRLSRLIAIPSTTARILLMAELGEYDRIRCGDVKDIVLEHFTAREDVAMKFSAGPYSAWVIKCGNRIGVALFEESRVRISGKDVVKKLDKVEEFVARAVNEYGATVMVYLVPKKLMLECRLMLERLGQA